MEHLKLIRLIAALAFLLASAPAFAQLNNPRVAALLAEPAAAPVPAQAAPVLAEPTAAVACDPLPFGQSMFTGGVEKSRTGLMSPQQRVVPGDRVSIAIWGAIEAEETQVVDSQGFIYIKGVGPIQVAGKTEESLAADIRTQIGTVFKDDVQVYARLEQNAGMPVMVTGGVSRPGQYFGSAEDNIVVWLQRAGGILPQQGSYRDVSVLRDGTALQTADLYSFLQNGAVDKVVWQPGDVIVVGAPLMQVSATGDVRRCATFEFLPSSATGEALITLAQPLPGVTHAVLDGFRDGVPYTQVLSLAALRSATLQGGDRARFYAAPQNEKITVTVEGPMLGNRILVVPMHSKLSDVLDHIPVDQSVSDTSSIYLKRVNVARMQQEALDESARRLLQSVLTAPAQSDGEAVIRANEAKLVEEFVLRIKDIRQEGRVVVMQNGALRDLPLENGDVIVIPQKTNVVSIEGEVVLPRAVVARDKATIEDYVMMAGGYTERALKNDYIVIQPNGDAIRSKNPDVSAGDRLLVLPRVDSKNMQTAKDLVQILYQVAVGAGVLLKL